MTHSEAVKEMAAERYLLDELSSEVRDDFEEHMFDCPQCALDVRAGAAFVNEAKHQLPELTAGLALPKRALSPAKEPSLWLSWLRPAFALPVFAALFLVVGYQNLVTVPALRKSAEMPSIVPTAPSYGATRGGNHILVTADRAHGVALPIDVPLDPAIGNFSSYSFDLYSPDGKLAWSGSVAGGAQAPGGELQLSVVIKGGMLQNGTYSVAVSGIGKNSERTPLDRFVFDVTLTN